MRSVEEIREVLKDVRLEDVASATGLGYYTLLRHRNGKVKRPPLQTMEKLSRWVGEYEISKLSETDRLLAEYEGCCMSAGEAIEEAERVRDALRERGIDVPSPAVRIALLKEEGFFDPKSPEPESPEIRTLPGITPPWRLPETP